MNGCDINLGCVEIDKQTACDALHVIFTEYLIVSFLFSMLNDKKYNTYCYVD